MTSENLLAWWCFLTIAAAPVLGWTLGPTFRRFPRRYITATAVAAVSIVLVSLSALSFRGKAADIVVISLVYPSLCLVAGAATRLWRRVALTLATLGTVLSLTVGFMLTLLIVIDATSSDDVSYSLECGYHVRLENWGYAFTRAGVDAAVLWTHKWAPFEFEIEREVFDGAIPSELRPACEAGVPVIIRGNEVVWRSTVGAG